jgi:hypothetical protein
MSPVAAVAAHTAMELVSGKMADHLREDSAAGVHAPLLTPKTAPLEAHQGRREFKSKTLRGEPNLSSIC